MSTPWEEIGTPNHEFLTRKVADSKDWNFFWAKDSDSRYALLFKTHIRPNNVKFPSIEGIHVELREFSDKKYGVALLLLEKVNADLFGRICRDIVAEANKFTKESAIPSIIAARLKMWQSLLKRGRNGLLTPDQQRGLIAELHVLGQIVTSRIGQEIALQSWLGPDRESHDFVIGSEAIEVKARTSRSNEVIISSENQLYHSGDLHIYTLIVDGSATPSQGESLNEIVARTRASFEAQNHELLDQKLFQAGYLEREEYDHSYYSIGDGFAYRVADGFPRISSENLNPSIYRVKYTLDLSQCNSWKVSTSEMISS